MIGMVLWHWSCLGLMPRFGDSRSSIFLVGAIAIPRPLDPAVDAIEGMFTSLMCAPPGFGIASLFRDSRRQKARTSCTQFLCFTTHCQTEWKKSNLSAAGRFSSLPDFDLPHEYRCALIKPRFCKKVPAHRQAVPHVRWTLQSTATGQLPGLWSITDAIWCPLVLPAPLCRLQGENTNKLSRYMIYVDMQWYSSCWISVSMDMRWGDFFP